MSIKLSEDKELVQEIRKKLKENSGYCPCKIEKTEDTKCMCKEFREHRWVFVHHRPVGFRRFGRYCR